MWVLRGYDTRDDKLSGELALDGFRLEDGIGLLGFAPTKLGSTPLEFDDAQEIAERYGRRLLKSPHLELFLDFDAEPQAVGRDRVPEAEAVT